MALIVRMIKGQRVRHVSSKVVGKMRQNGWTVADDPPKRKRRSAESDSKPSETDSGGSFMPEHEEES